MTTVSSTSPAPAADLTPVEKLKKIAQSLVDWAVLIIMMVLPSIVKDYRIAFGVSFGVGVILMFYSFHQYRNGNLKVFPKVFEVGVVVINLAVLIFELVQDPTYEWSKLWTGVITSGCLLALTVVSILIGKPFTLQFAMEKVDEQYWGTDIFYNMNLIISAVWGLEFALSVMFSLLTIYVYPDNDAARIAPGIVILVLALKFTAEYPAYVRERAKQARISQEGHNMDDVEGNTTPSSPIHSK